MARRVTIGTPAYYEMLGRGGTSQFFRTLAAVRKAQKRAGGGGEIIDIVDSRGRHSGYVVIRNPAGESAFDRCVAEVAARGTARDPRAVCATAGRRKYGQAEMTRRSVAGRRRAARAARGNPAEGAAAVSEEFHGRTVQEIIKVTQRRHYHKHLAELGKLRKLIVLTGDGRRRVTMHNFSGTLLCANEEKNQLYILGGNQAAHLRDFGISRPHEVEDLGAIEEVDYYTTKEHLGRQGGEATYWHRFKQPRPTLHFRLRDSTLEISGGRYRITAEGIED